MTFKILPLGVAIIAAALAGCGKKADTPRTAAADAPKPVTIAVVKEPERSASFLAVNQHLELGGTLYGYVDIDGDVLKLTGALQDLLKQIAAAQPQLEPYAKQDFGAIAQKLGLTDIKAVGVSSVPDGTGFFRNRAFFYTPGDRHGLLLGLGGKPGPFTQLKLAPADAAFYSEADVDVAVVYRTLKDVVTQVAGEQASNQMEAAIRKAGEEAAISLLDLIYGLKGHSSVVLRVDPEKTIQLPGGGVTLPAFSMLLCVEGVAPVIEPALAKVPVIKRTDSGNVHVYEIAQPSPIPELQPVLVADGNTLYFATTRAFLDECRSLKSGLGDTDEFKKALAAVGTEGNGISYVHPRVFDALRRIETLNPSLPPQVKQVMSMILAKTPKLDRPMVALRTNLDDGILVQSYWNRSFKQEVAMISAYNPVTVGVLAAMAIPAFQKVRASSQEKAVLNNLRQLSSAADQYYLEKGVTTATYDDLVGPGRDKYIKRIEPVAGENYRQLHFQQGEPLRVRLKSGKVVEYGE